MNVPAGIQPFPSFPQAPHPTNPLIGVRKPSAAPPVEPTRTLYVRNLNESINFKSKKFEFFLLQKETL